MRVVVLVDNNTYIDQYYIGEPAVSYYIECGGGRILFDAGYSDAFLKNAEALGIDLMGITDIVISHGHDDHTRGLKFFLPRLEKGRVRLTAHPSSFDKKVKNGVSIGSPLTVEEAGGYCKLLLSKEPVEIFKDLFFLGEIPSLNDFEERRPIGQTEAAGRCQNDILMDDTALAYRGADGIHIITGCSHSGICNIIEYAKAVLGDNRVCGVLGGFHLFDVDERALKTIEYLSHNTVKKLCPCHCVSFFVKAEMHKAIPIREVGVGMEYCPG